MYLVQKAARAHEVMDLNWPNVDLSVILLSNFMFIFQINFPDIVTYYTKFQEKLFTPVYIPWEM